MDLNSTNTFVDFSPLSILRRPRKEKGNRRGQVSVGQSGQ